MRERRRLAHHLRLAIDRSIGGGQATGIPIGATIEVLLGGLARGAVGWRTRRRLLGSSRETILLADNSGIDLIVALSWGEKLFDQIALGNFLGLCEEILDVSVQVVKATFRNSVSHVVNGTRHIWESSFLALDITSLDGEFCQERNLEIVKVFVVSGELPCSAIFQNGLDDEPVLLFGETVPGYPGRDRGIQLGGSGLDFVGAALKSVPLSTELALLLLCSLLRDAGQCMSFESKQM